MRATAPIRLPASVPVSALVLPFDPRSARRHPAAVTFCVALVLFMGYVTPTAARAADEPSVAQLIAMCDRGRAAGDVGMDAAMCEWFAVPCDCAGKRPATAERWCMPDNEPIEAALPKVLAELRRSPSQSAPAKAVVEDVMVRLYPCADEQAR